MTRYSLDLRRRAVKAYKTQKTSIRSVASVFQISPSTLMAWLKLERKNGNLHPQPSRGGPPSRLQGREDQLRAMVQAHPDYTLSEYCESWRAQTQQDVPISTMSRWLIQQGYSYKKNDTVSESGHGSRAAATG